MIQREALASASTPQVDNTKVQPYTDIAKVADFFRYKVGTSLDCARATGILRNSICFYIRDLEDLDIIRCVRIQRDSTTGYKAKHYSADRSLWDQQPKQLTLFNQYEG